MRCPKCGFVQEDSAVECLRCGLVMSKWERHSGPLQRTNEAVPAPEGDVSADLRACRPDANSAVADGRKVGVAFPHEARAHRPGRPSTSPSAAVAAGDHDQEIYESQGYDNEVVVVGPAEVRHLERNDWLVLAAGPVVALVIVSIPLLNHIFMTFMTLIHEMGHTLAGWFFGYPSLPAFDLRYGGGVTATMERSWLLLAVVYGLMGLALYTYRNNRSTTIMLSLLIVVHLWLSLTDLHNVVFLAMGHGMELIIAAIFFYRGLSGAAVIHAAERPLYCVISCFIVLTDTRFAYRLLTSAHERHMYEDAKGGGHWMDFSRIAEDYVHTDLKRVALFFFFGCILPLMVGYLAFRYQEYLRRAVTRLLVREPSTVG